MAPAATIGWSFDANEPAWPFDPDWHHAAWQGDAWTSDERAIPPSSRLTLSWNVGPGTGSVMVFDLTVRIGGEWSPWTRVGYSGDAGYSPSPPGPVRVDVDVACWDGQGDRIRVRATRTAAPANEGPGESAADLFRVAASAPRPVDADSVDGRQPPRRSRFVQSVPFRSQMTEDERLAKRLCGPTSLAMIVAASGEEATTAEVAERAFDSDHDLYGNWSSLARAASEYGLAAWVEYLTCLADAERRLEAGYHAILSLAFEEGQIDGTPIARTNGHLLVLRGWSSAGDPICNDPAFADGSGDGIAYPRDQFEDAWLGHGGVAIVVRPS